MCDEHIYADDSCDGDFLLLSKSNIICYNLWVNIR